MKLSLPYPYNNKQCRSREGAWIEIYSLVSNMNKKQVAPVRERGLKFSVGINNVITCTVAPVRERGLKSYNKDYVGATAESRSREGAWIEIHAKPISSAGKSSLP